MKYAIIFTIVLGILLGCDPYNQDGYKEYVVVEAYAVAERSLPIVRISRTIPVDEEYSFSDTALSGANVQITLLDENGNDLQNFPYNQVSDGIYQSSNLFHSVRPRHTYRIDINFNDRDDELTAQTTVPDQFSIINEIPDTLTYLGDQQLEILLSATQQTQYQKVYVFNTIKENSELELLTPFYLDAVINGDSEVQDFANNSSGLVNEGNFTLNDDGTTTLLFPWIGVAFFEENKVVTNSVDTNIRDLIRSQDVQLGGSTLPPGEIPNVRYNIEGGIGIFGSVASDTVTTFFERPDGF